MNANTPTPETQKTSKATAAKSDNRLAEALCEFAAAQSEFDPISFDKVNPHFKSKYASLPAILKATLPHLAKHNILALQRTYVDGENVMCETSLCHKDFTFSTATWPIGKVATLPQQLGSALTYARRYTLQCVLGVVAEDDDDGNAAQKQSAAPNPSF